jgi:hypothetical protein
MRVLGWSALVALSVGGCTSVRMVERDGCWVRQTQQRVTGRVLEEVGPCAPTAPQWSQDRLTRLVQECVADAERRQHARALEVWSRRLPYATPLPSPQEQLRSCLEEAKVTLASENEGLRDRLAELTRERDALRADAARDHAKLQESQERLAEWLGKAAQKPAGTATATASATSDGKATNESGATLAAESGSAPAAAQAAPAKDASSGARYSRKPTPTRNISVPSSARRSTDCSR